MENENVKEETPVQEVEEIITDEQVEEKVDTEEEDSMDAFKPESFMEEDEVESSNKKEEENQEEEKPEESESDDDNTFVWDMDEEDKGEEANVEAETDIIDESVEESTPEPVESSETFEAPVFEEFQKLGIEAKDTGELLAKVKELVDDNVSYQTKYVSNDKIEFWKKTLSLNNKALVKKILESEGFEGDKLDEAVDTYESNGTLEIEATRYRNNIRNRIKTEVDGINRGNKEAEAKQQQNREEARGQLQQHLGETETMFGFKMAKDDKSLSKVREGHFDYIDSGEFMNDVLKDPQSISEAAWFQKHKATILKALQNKGKQAGKQEILNDIHEATPNKTERILSPDDDTEFNPTKFTNVE